LLLGNFSATAVRGAMRSAEMEMEGILLTNRWDKVSGEAFLGSAQGLAQRLVQDQRQALGADHPATALALVELASVKLASGLKFYKLDNDARPGIDQARAVLAKTVGDDHPWALRAKELDGWLKDANDKHDEALRLYDDIVKAKTALPELYGRQSRDRTRQARDEVAEN
jgi:hypothetical protein